MGGFYKGVEADWMREASYTSLRSGKDLTNLTMEAMALVNEEIMGPADTDGVKFEDLLEDRK